MSTPDLIQQQREILQRFRIVNQERIQTEAETELRFKTGIISADTSLQQAKQAADALLTQTTTHAEESRKAEYEAAAATLRKIQAAHAVYTDTINKAQKRVKNGLDRVDLTQLLEQTRPEPSSIRPEDDLSQALGHRAKIATEIAERLTFITVALHIKRIAAEARRRRQPVIIAIVIIALSVAVFVGYEAWQVKQREWNIQATATSLVVQATEQAIPIQATATALATQAQISMPPEFQELFERFGIILVYVAPGEFAMGSPEGEGNSDQHPQHMITLDGFWIGLTEVTNAQYQLFVDAKGYQKQELWTKAGWAWRKSNAITQPGCWSDVNITQPNFPVICVSWYEALAYTRWLAQEAKLNIRLPTEAEWEKTARGTDGRIYPWGDQEPTSDLVNIRSSIRQPEAVASYAKGASFYDALDMAGNVWEWTSTIYQPYPYDSEDGREVIDADGLRVLRGGSNRRSAYRSFKLKVDTRSEDIGFRIILADSASTISKSSDH